MTGVDSDLAAVIGLLAATRLPPMPDRLAERMQLAIASEAAERAAAERGLAAVAPAPPVAGARISRAGR